MTRNDGTRPFIEKVANDTRQYVQSLIDENCRLSKEVAELESERDRSRQAEAVLKERLEAIEQESQSFSARYVEVEQQNTNLANLYVASYQLHGTLDRDRVLGAIKEIVINLIGSEELAIWEIDHEFDAMVLIDSFGIDADKWAALPLDSPGVIGLVAATGESYIGGRSPIHFRGQEENLVACIPLKLDERVIAVIAIFSLLQQKSGLEALDFELFDLLASHGATALHCTRLAMAECVQ
jgi:GAF domain-containing protein